MYGDGVWISIILFLIDISVKQTPSQDIETPISFLDNVMFDFIKILIPFGLFTILFIIPLLKIIPLNILSFINGNTVFG